MSKFATYIPTEEKIPDWIARNDDPVVKTVELVFPSLPCPRCRTPAPRRGIISRHVFDYGDEQQARPLQIHLRLSKHRCPQCQLYLYPDTADIAPSKSRYTHRVIRHALRLVIEDNLPYRSASWNLWRDHAVFVPFATIQNWVEAAGKKSRGSRRPTRVPR